MNIPATAIPAEQSKLSGRFVDFWMLGGASLVVWALINFGELYRRDYSYVNQRFEQVAATFGLLSLICNYPHFLASYRMAYGRGWGFCRQNWFSMLLVPGLLAGLYAVAFFWLQSSIAEAAWVLPINSMLEKMGLDYRIGLAENLGSELLVASIWLMYFTVGWHYAKQVFGCMMVYANYDGYPLTARQRLFTKGCLFSVAFYSFCHLNFHWRDYFPFARAFSLNGFPVAELGLPALLEPAASLAVVLSAAAFLYFVLIENYLRLGKNPSANFLVPLAAFFAWWIPYFRQKEYYFMMVPFFHSLQYLPFAFRVEMATIKNKANVERSFWIRALALFGLGFVAFEALPAALDSGFAERLGNIPAFFTIAFAVFINVHHFFLDSVLWRFRDRTVHAALLSEQDARRIRNATLA